MRLTRLEIENFKGIGERQVIDIRPITLLFGPNSAGKSSILQAVQYFHQVLKGELSRRNGDSDPQNKSAMENFKSLVHCHDLTKTIKIKAFVNLNENFHNENFPINYGGIVESGSDKGLPIILSNLLEDNKLGELTASYLNGDEEYCKVTDVAVAIEVAWEEDSALFVSREYLKSLEIDINNQEMIRIRIKSPSAEIVGLPPYSYRAKVEVNRNHYLLNEFSDANKVDYELKQQIESNVYELREKEKNWPAREIKEIESKREEESDRDKNPKDQVALSSFEKELYKLIHGSIEGMDMPEIGDSITFEIAKMDLAFIHEYSIYKIDTDFVLPINLVSQEKDNDGTGKYASNNKGSKWLRIDLLFSELISGPIQSALGATEVSPESAYFPSSTVGPLRPIPSRGKSGTKLDKPDDSEILRKVNYWLEQRFELDYSIKRYTLKFLSEDSGISIDSKAEISKIEGEHMMEPGSLFPDMPKRYQTVIKLYDKRRQINLDFVDVGVGMPQLVPVLVEALQDEFGLVAMEQPELHLHPAIQVELGDLFIESACEHSGMERVFLIETHSEHLLLRLLRRIQENTDNELPSDAVPLRTEDLSVIYIEPVHTEIRTRTRIKRLRVDKTGEFEDRWPNGFFTERRKELF